MPLLRMFEENKRKRGDYAGEVSILLALSLTGCLLVIDLTLSPSLGFPFTDRRPRPLTILYQFALVNSVEEEIYRLLNIVQHLMIVTHLDSSDE